MTLYNLLMQHHNNYYTQIEFNLNSDLMVKQYNKMHVLFGVCSLVIV